MRALIRKEWRENRWLIVGFVLLAPLLSIGLKWGIVGWKDTQPFHSVKIVLPILTLLYVLAIAADIVAADASTGRMGFLLSLPLRASRVWAAKAAFLFGGAALFMAYVLLVEVVVLSFAGKVVADMFAAASLRTLFLMVPVLVVGCATMAFSALVDRGLAAAILALLFVGGIAWAAKSLGDMGVRIRPDGPTFYSLSALVAGAFLAASFAAATIGRIHLPARVRRVALATAAFLVVIVPPTAWAGARVYRWRHIEPHHEDIWISRVLDMDPRGEWALVEVTRHGDGPASVTYAPHVIWAVGVESGLVRDLTKYGWVYNRHDSWQEGPGRVVLHRWEPDPDGKTSVCLRVVYDLSIGEAVSTRPIAPDAPDPMGMAYRGPLLTETVWDADAKRKRHHIHRVGREPLVIEGDWMLSPTAHEWGLPVSRFEKGAGREYRLLMAATGEMHPLAAMPGLLPSSPDRPGWTVRTRGEVGSTNCRIDRVPLDGSPAETVVTGKGTGTTAPTSDYAFAWIDGRAFWVDPDADEPLHLTDVALEDPEPRIQWSVDGRICLVTDHESAYHIHASAAGPRVERIPPPPIERRRSHYSPWFNGERWILIGGADSSLHVLEMDGSHRRLLPTGEGSR